MSFLSKIFLGVDLAEEQKRGDLLDAQGQKAAQDYQPGGRLYNKIAAEQGTAAADAAATQVEQHFEQGVTGNVTDQVGQAFYDGLQEGASNIRTGVDKTVLGVLTTALKTVPITVWIAAAAFAFFYFGGLGLIKRKLGK